MRVITHNCPAIPCPNYCLSTSCHELPLQFRNYFKTFKRPSTKHVCALTKTHGVKPSVEALQDPSSPHRKPQRHSAQTQHNPPRVSLGNKTSKPFRTQRIQWEKSLICTKSKQNLKHSITNKMMMRWKWPPVQYLEKFNLPRQNFCTGNCSE